MDIKTELKTLALSLADSNGAGIFGGAYYGSDFEMNMNDDTEFPLVHIQQILSSGADVSLTTGSMNNRWNLFILFADKTELEVTADQNEVIVNDMRNKALIYINALSKSGLVKPISKIEFKHLFFKFDFTVTGVLAFFQVTEKLATPIC